MALVPRGGSGVVRAGRMPRPIAQQVEAVRYAGMVTAAEIQAAALVTHTALDLVAMLSAQESRLVGMCALGEARYRLLVDSFTGVAAGTIARMGW
jgi:hypothetical protein